MTFEFRMCGLTRKQDKADCTTGSPVFPIVCRFRRRRPSVRACNLRRSCSRNSDARGLISTTRPSLIRRQRLPRHRIHVTAHVLDGLRNGDRNTCRSAELRQAGIAQIRTPRRNRLRGARESSGNAESVARPVHAGAVRARPTIAARTTGSVTVSAAPAVIQAAASQSRLQHCNSHQNKSQTLHQEFLSDLTIS